MLPCHKDDIDASRRQRDFLKAEERYGIVVSLGSRVRRFSFYQRDTPREGHAAWRWPRCRQPAFARRRRISSRLYTLCTGHRVRRVIGRRVTYD